MTADPALPADPGLPAGTAPPARPLLAALHAPHDAATAVLGEGRAGSLAAVTWTSTHLGAVSRVLHPVVARRLPDGAARARALAAADRALQRALWLLDHRLTGDVHCAAGDVAALEARVAAALRRHEQPEADAAAALAAVLDEAEQADLAERLERAVRHAPTRPHPDAPVRGPVAGLVYRVDAGADRLRDLFDTRDVPSPHDVPAPRVPGRWGSYLMAQPPRDRSAGR